jgi:DNA-binding MarR family transcriptional regulator
MSSGVAYKSRLKAHMRITARKSAAKARRSRRTRVAPKSLMPQVQNALELFLFAHLNLAADAEDELTAFGFHRTHHRILYLVAGHPGISMGELISTLRLTPQAVQSPMKQLNENGFVEQRYANADRRKRCLFITPAGDALLSRLSSRQHKRLAQAFRQAGPAAVNGFFLVLEGMLTKDDREFLERSFV